MALSGALDTFSIPDVLHLLAGTGKTGVLTVEGDRGRGRIWLDGGSLVEAEATDGRSVHPDAGVFELLRFRTGTFEFDGQGASARPGEHCDVDEALARATALLEEWHEIEAVVPSLDVRVQLRADVDDEVILQPHQWRMVTSIGRADTGRALAALLDLGELEVCRVLRDLVVGGLADVEVIEARAAALAPELAIVSEAPASAGLGVHRDDGVTASASTAPASSPGLGLHLATFVATGEAPDVEVHVPDFRAADVVEEEPEPVAPDAEPVWDPIRDAVAAEPPTVADVPGSEALADGAVEVASEAEGWSEEPHESEADLGAADLHTEPETAEVVEDDPEPEGSPEDVQVGEAASDDADGDADDFLNQLANLSPRAKAAIEATAAPDELGAQPAAETGPADDPADAGEVNQNLLLRFLSSTKP